MNRRHSNINMVMFRRNYKMKIRLLSEYNDLVAGTELTKVTLVRGNYTGVAVLAGKEVLRTVPIHKAIEI